jgi:hypothetical protein
VRGPEAVFSRAAGSVIISADRLFGVSAWSGSSSISTTTTSGGAQSSAPVKVDAEGSGTQVNLLWGSSGTGGGGENPFAVPRLAIDFFVGNGVTVGGSFGFASTSGSSKSTTHRFSQGSSTSIDKNADLPDISSFVVAPRFGVVVPAGKQVAFWLRGGVTYFHSSSEETETTPATSSGGGTSTKTTGSSSGTALTFEPTLVIMPAPHVGLTLGPVFDIGLEGSAEAEGTATQGGTSVTFRATGDQKFSSYGGAAGLLVFF